MTVPRNTVTARVKRIRRAMDALDMVSASMDSALVSTDGEELTATHVALDTDSVAAEMESASRESATATLDGLVMRATSAHASTIVPSTDTATTVPAFARRDTVDVIALCLLNPSRASAPSIASVAACSSAPRFMRLRVLDRRMSATPSAPRSVYHSALLERCL